MLEPQEASMFRLRAEEEEPEKEMEKSTQNRGMREWGPVSGVRCFQEESVTPSADAEVYKIRRGVAVITCISRGCQVG